MAAGMAVRILLNDSLALVLPVSLGAALAWQLSPAKQACLNRCHRRPRLAAFGWQAERDCLRFGMMSGVWCCGTCWGWMFATVAAGRWHLPVMAACMACMLLERCVPSPLPPLPSLPALGRSR